MKKVRGANLRGEKHFCPYCLLKFRLQIAYENHLRDHSFYPLLTEGRELFMKRPGEVHG